MQAHESPDREVTAHLIIRSHSSERQPHATMMSQSSSGRSRFSGTEVQFEEIARAIAEVAHFPDFVEYQEDLNAAADVSKVKQLGGMWAAIRRVHQPLTFNQTQMESILHRVAAVRSQGDGVRPWKRQLTATEMQDWSRSVGRQLRAQARHLGQALIKKTSWAMKLMGQVDDDIGSAPKSRCSDEASQAPEYFYGWDCEQGAAWRARASDGYKEFSNSMFEQGGNTLLANFETGPAIKITAITVQDWRQQVIGNKLSGMGSCVAG